MEHYERDFIESTESFNGLVSVISYFSDNIE